MTSDFERARVRRQLRADLFGKATSGHRIGRFEVLDLIGTGASSHVYMGRDPDLDRHVAIKIVHQRSGVSDSMRARLTREGRALASLSHANVLRIFELGTHEGDVFLAVELVDGQDLAAWLIEQPHSWPDVVGVMSAAGAGLAAAHELGLVHRDVKPANVLIDTKGTVRVADFGLVQPFGDSESADPTGETARASVTQTGAQVGSPAYMAPEQWAGRAVDARTDQFGYCVTFHEALHGERPFQGNTEQELVAAIGEGRLTAPATSDIPDWLDAIVGRGLSPDPEDRYPSMTELLADLNRKHTSHELVREATEHAAKMNASEVATEVSHHGGAAQTAFTAALKAWPEHVAAQQGRDAVLKRLVEHDLGQGALDNAAGRLTELAETDPDLVTKLHLARDAAIQAETGLAKLAAIEHDESPYVSLGAKLRILLIQGPVAAAVMVGLGEANRRGWVEIGSKQLCLLFTSYFGVSYLLFVLKKQMFQPNRNTRLLVELGMMNIAGAALMFGFGAWAELQTWEVLLFIQLMRSTFWLGGGIYIDRRLFYLAGIAIAAAIATKYYPDYGIDAYGVSAGLALMLLAWRTLADAPDRDS